jgi:hypothetical protein
LTFQKALKEMEKRKRRGRSSVGHESEFVVAAQLGRTKHAVMRRRISDALFHFRQLKRGDWLERPSAPQILGLFLCSIYAGGSFFRAVLHETTTTMRGWWEQGRLEPAGWDKRLQAVVETSSKLVAF